MTPITLTQAQLDNHHLDPETILAVCEYAITHAKIGSWAWDIAIDIQAKALNHCFEEINGDELFALQQWVSGKLADQSQSSYEDAIQTLRQIALEIEKTLLPGKIEICLAQSYHTDIGRQHKVVLRIPEQQYSDILLRAYVPVEGYPVTLDLFDDLCPSCADATAIKSTVKDFLQHKDVQRLLKSLIEKASKE